VFAHTGEGAGAGFLKAVRSIVFGPFVHSGTFFFGIGFGHTEKRLTMFVGHKFSVG